MRQESGQVVEDAEDAKAKEDDGDEFKCVPCGDLNAEDIMPWRRPTIPKMPSASEVEDHRKSHLPYRSWCRECVMGRGLGEPHRSHTQVEHTVPRVGIDYWYITTGGLKTYSELEYGETKEGKAKFLEDRKKGVVVKCLIVRCHETKSLFAHVVPCKGADEENYM